MSSAALVIECAGCGDTLPIESERFSEWWVEHGQCLRELYSEPPREIDHRLRERLRVDTPAEAREDAFLSMPPTPPYRERQA